MRIIAGEHRGRKLLPPEGDATRPITDRVKQSVFDILSPLIPDAVVYDCFAGTGSMGLECLSRCARRATFFEADKSALKRLRSNIDAVDCADRSTVHSGDLFKLLATKPAAPNSVDLIFLDPPYRFLNEKPDTLRTLAEHLAAYHLSPEGWVVFRHDAADALELPVLPARDVRTYGSMIVEFLRRRPDPATGAATETSNG